MGAKSRGRTQGPLGPHQRWSARRKREVVLRLLSGEPDLQPLRPGEFMAIKTDPGLARKLLGWEPQTDLAHGLRMTVGHFRAKGSQTSLA